MIYLFDIYDRVLAACANGSQEDSKRIAELSMALHYILKFYPPDAYSKVAVKKLESALYDYIHSQDYLKLLNDYFLVQQHITPYIFIRSGITQSRYFEGLLSIFQEFDHSLQENFPYRALERNHLLYKLDCQPITVSFNNPIFDDALQIQSFNRDLSYAFTHTVFYSTDFSDLKIIDKKVKDCCKILMAQSFNANDIDLFLEICICFLSQDISDDEFEDMTGLIHQLQLKNALLFECRDVTDDYHPLFVHDILRGLILRRFNFDIIYTATSTCTDSTERNEGPIGSLWPIYLALKGKDPEKILSSYDGYFNHWGRMPFLEEIIDHKLNSLNVLAHQEVLFEREFCYLGQHRFDLYIEFQDQLKALVDRYQWVGSLKQT